MKRFASGAVALLLATTALSPALAQAVSPDRVAAVHRAALVIDPHVDLPAPYDWTADGPPRGAPDQASLDRLKVGGFDAVGLSVFVSQSERTPEKTAAARAEARTKLAAIQSLATTNRNAVEIARTAADVRRISGQGKTAVLIGLLNAYPLGRNAAALEDYARQGVRLVGLTHAGNNDFADSSRPQPRDRPFEHGGLSPAGRELIKEANRLGVVVDVSQISEAAFQQAVGLSEVPVLASHSGVKGKVNAARNLSDAELDALKANGGVVGIVAFSSYLKPVPEENQRKIAEIRRRYGAVNGYEGLSREQREALGAETRALTPRASVADLVDSVDYAVKRIGIDHVAISSDFNHGGGVEGWSHAGEAANVTAELLRRGYSEADIGKLWGGNVLRVLERAEAHAARVQRIAAR